MAVKYLLFDFDGTLADSSQGIIAAMRHALVKNDLSRADLDDSALRRNIGPPLLTMINNLLGQQASQDQAAQVAADYREYYSEKGLFQARLYAGVEDALRALSGRYACYIVTSKPREFVARLVKKLNLEGYFKGIYGPDLSLVPRKKAGLIGDLLRETGIGAGECVMIGDKAEDVAASKSNGIKSVGVTYGFGTREELLASGADGLAAAPEELAPEMFEALQRKAGV